MRRYVVQWPESELEKLEQELARNRKVLDSESVQIVATGIRIGPELGQVDSVTALERELLRW